jgi:competence protein ComEA
MTTGKFSSYRRLITVLLIAVTIIASLIAGQGCGGSRPIEISLSPPDIQQAGQIYIGGAVNNPGFYQLAPGDSIESLIRAAGGTSDGADPNQIKLLISEAGVEERPQKIDLNRADSWLLEALPGIGEVRAGDIISYREQNGLFRNINELLKVKGIGPATFEQIKDLVTVAG